MLEEIEKKRLKEEATKLAKKTMLAAKVASDLGANKSKNWTIKQ